MIYKCLIHTPDSNKGVTRDFNLNILPNETVKLKNFATAYSLLTGNYAVITKMDCTVYSANKPMFNTDNYPSVKVMYSTTKGSIKNVTLPYVKKTQTKNDIVNFMKLYIEDYKGLVSDPLYKKII